MRLDWNRMGAACALALITLAPAAASAGKVTIQAEASTTRVSPGELFSVNVQVVIDGTSADPQYTPPALDGLELVRKSTQRGQSFVMNFGAQPKTTLTTTYTYVVQAPRPGKAKIGAASARLGSDLAATEPIEIEVSGAGGQPSKARPDAPPSVPNDKGQASGRADPILLRVVPDKFDAFVGEQVVLSVFLLARVELTDIQSLKQPQLEGVLLERDDRPRTNLVPKVQRFGGEEYNVYEIARYAMFALRDGPVTVGAFSIEAAGGMGFFTQGRSYQATSPDVVVQVKPLPATRPAGFSPMNVGEFQFSAQLLGQTTQVGKPLTLRLAVSGVGNVSKLALPVPRFPKNVKAYDPETKSEQKFNDGVLSGRIVRDYLFVPTEAGEFQVPELVFSAFDPKAGQFREQKAGPFAFAAAGEAGAAAVAKPTTTARPDDKPLGAIRLSSQLLDDRDSGDQAAFIWFGGSAGLAAALAITVTRRSKREKTPAEIARGARAKANKGLKAALGQADSRDSYAAMHKVVRQYLSERYGISLGTGRDRLRELLLGAGVSERNTDRLLAELDNCDFARFAPGGDLPREAEAARNRLEDALDGLEKSKGAA